MALPVKNNYSTKNYQVDTSLPLLLPCLKFSPLQRTGSLSFLMARSASFHVYMSLPLFLVLSKCSSKNYMENYFDHMNYLKELMGKNDLFQ